MKTVVPDYYPQFKCIAEKCRHTCCRGWEVDIDPESAEKFAQIPKIAEKMDDEGGPHFTLNEDESCPFLRSDGLCSMIITYGESILCDICRDHPRFRNYFTDRVEMGLGLVCEEAGRLILGRETPMKLITISDDGVEEKQPEDEIWLTEVRDYLLNSALEGPEARLTEYLVYRHLPDALYDGKLDERVEFIKQARDEIVSAWKNTDGSLDALVECARAFSYDVEYDDEELERRIAAFSK